MDNEFRIRNGPIDRTFKKVKKFDRKNAQKSKRITECD